MGNIIEMSQGTLKKGIPWDGGEDKLVRQLGQRVVITSTSSLIFFYHNFRRKLVNSSKLVTVGSVKLENNEKLSGKNPQDCVKL